MDVRRLGSGVVTKHAVSEGEAARVPKVYAGAMPHGPLPSLGEVLSSLWAGWG